MLGIRERWCVLLVMVGAVLSTAGTAVLAVDEYPNPLKFDTLGQVLGSALDTMQALIVILAIIFMIIGALLYMTSAGNESRMTTGKSAMMASLIGLALGLAAPSFLKEIAAILGWATTERAIVNAPGLTTLLGRVLDFLLAIIGVIAVIMLVIGGLMYLTAGGDESKAEVGKKIVTYSVIGIVVCLAALVIITQVAKFF